MRHFLFSNFPFQFFPFPCFSEEKDGEISASGQLEMYFYFWFCNSATESKLDDLLLKWLKGMCLIQHIAFQKCPTPGTLWTSDNGFNCESKGRRQADEHGRRSCCLYLHSLRKAPVPLLWWWSSAASKSRPESSNGTTGFWKLLQFFLAISSVSTLFCQTPFRIWQGLSGYGISQEYPYEILFYIAQAIFLL